MYKEIIRLKLLVGKLYNSASQVNDLNDELWDKLELGIMGTVDSKDIMKDVVMQDILEDIEKALDFAKEEVLMLEETVKKLKGGKQ